MKHNNDVQSKSPSYLGWFLWLLATAFFAFQMIPRLWLGVIKDQVMSRMNVGPDIFGYICAAYYVGYAGMQIPLAMLLGRWSPRWVLSGCAFLLGLSLWMQGVATDWPVAALARFLTGLSSAAGFLGVSRVLEQWFPAKMYGTILGLSVSLGILGAVYGGFPMSGLAKNYGADVVNDGMIFFCFGLAAMMVIIMRSPAHQTNHSTMSFGLLKQLFYSPTIWILGIINLLLVGPLEGFADAWAEPFLSKGFDILPDHALGLSSLVFIGLISGSPIVPFLGQRFGHRAAILWCALGIVGTFTLLFYMSLGQYVSVSPHWFIGGLLFFIGMCCSYQTNLLTMGRESVSPQLGGVAVALLNAWNMSGGTIFHTIIGFVLKNRPTATSSSMASVNNVIALSCIPLAAVVGVVLLMTMVRPRRSDENRI